MNQLNDAKSNSVFFLGTSVNVHNFQEYNHHYKATYLLPF